MIEPQDIQKLRDLPIEEVAERVGLTVKRHKSLCPFHNDTVPSLTYYRARNTYRCFVCDAHGSTIDLVMHQLRLNFPQACQWLADSNNVILFQPPPPPPREPAPFQAERYQRFFEHPFLTEAARRFLFEERHIDPRVVSWCRLNSYQDKHGTPWLQTPYFDEQWRLRGIQLRNLAPSTETNEPRFRFPQGSQCHIYNLPVLQRLRPGEALYITEGCSDCWAMLSSGRKAVAIPSATLLKAEDLRPLQECHRRLGTTFHMYPDQDSPGQRLYLELQERLSPIALHHHQLPEGVKDFGEWWGKQINNE